MPVVALVAALASLAGAIVGAVSEANKEAYAKSLMDRASKRYGSITLPNLQSILAEDIGPSKAAQIVADPSLKAMQQKALDKMQQSVDDGGMTLEDRAMQADALNSVARQDKASRGAINNQMQARGTADSGTALAMSLENTQQAADRGGDIGLKTAANAQRRYLDSILNAGKMASDMRGQDYTERSAAAHAEDEMNKYNAGKRRQAAEYANNQRQQNYDNQMGLYGAQNGQDYKGVDRADRQGKEAAQSAAGWGAAAGEGVKTGYAAYKYSQDGQGGSATPVVDPNTGLYKTEEYDPNA